VETVRQHKKLVIATIALLFFALIVAGFHWQTMPGNPLPSPSPVPTPTPHSLPSSSPSVFPSPSQTPSPQLPSILPTPPAVLLPQEDLSPIAAFEENSIEGPQHVPIEAYRLNITGLVNTTMAYAYDEVLNSFQKYRKVVTLNCVEGWSVTILWRAS